MFTYVRRKTLVLLVSFIGFLFFSTVTPLSAQSKSMVWQQFNVDISVNQDGTFDVAEAQTIDFTSGSFQFGYRDIPIQYLDYIDNWALTDSDGNIYRQAATEDVPYTFTVEDTGSRYILYWYFPAQSNVTKTYNLSYKVHGGLRYYEGGDQLWWKAIYGERDFPVLDGTVRVALPETAEVVEWAAYVNGLDARDRADAAISDDGHAVQFLLQERLTAGEEFEVRVQFPPNIVAGSASAWQQRADEIAAQQEAELLYRQTWGPWATLAFGGLGILFLLGGPALLYLLWYKFGRDKPVEVVADYLPEPPDALPPAMVGTLVDERVDMSDIIATLVDLAQRKVISITEEQSEGFLRTGSDFIYRQEDSNPKLLPYEQQLVSALFSGKDEVRLSELKNKFYTKLPDLQQSLYRAVTDAGLFPQNPNQTRNVYAGFAIAMLIFSVPIGVVLVSMFGDLSVAAALPAIGLAVTAVGMLILSRSMPRKTEEGALLAARWNAFKRYLQNIDLYADMDAQKAIWDRWLPYAIAFGVDKAYIRKFEAVNAPAPGWYIPDPTLYGPYRRRYYGPYIGGSRGNGTGEASGPMKETGGGLGGGLGDASRGMGTSLSSMSAGLGTLLASASSTMTSQPANTSSGSGWSGGGGGFSGGGSFGGGGGGGGGGGFG